ncbi:PREDICTED: pentatricopeptide repeat-containing protein At1g68980, mitochondrial-like [Camelina sativa]|uniref:Pentatricopeptide repeat-containing protein At1g68980, mitochondrial-like n=1 Tax=Camelina sativa TaxID=90675 RepID=A0ABM0Z8I6_CAMSA|nr:PREDICTED: pentatricopeptide repeat-containing protein At1g68980, mitochondrial-like [Camelina sativa]
MLRKTLTLISLRRPFSSIPPKPSPKTLTLHQKTTFESTLHHSLIAHDTDQAWKVFRSLAAASSLPDKSLLNSLITHLSSFNQADQNTSLRHRLKRAFVSATYVIEKDPILLEFETVRTVLESMKHAKASGPALALVECMFKNRYFVPFDLWGHLIIDICRDNGTLAAFLKVFKESCRIAVDEKLDFMKPDLVASNAALEACCKQLESMADAENVIESMAVLGVKPDESSFGFLAYLYARKGIQEKLSELENLMDGFGFVSRKILYSNMISGYVKSGDLDCVSDVILHSLKRGGEDSSFSEETYFELVKGFIENKSVNKLATLIIEAQKFESLSIEVDGSVGFGIVNACVKLGFSGKSILDEMNAQGGSGGIGVYVPILNAYCKEGRTGEATQLVTEISRSGLQLDVETYNTMIEASMSKQDFVSALTLFRDMRETRDLDLKGCYLTIMTGLLENQRPELMEEFVEEVLEDPRVEVKSHDWNSIIHAYCKSERLEDAKITFRRMAFLQYEANNQTYLSLINGYVSCEKYFEVVVLWKEFKDKKAKLEHALADAFLNGLVKGGFFGTALQVIEKCQEMKIFVDRWRYKATFMETQKNLRLPKLRKRKMKKIEFLDAFKNWAGLTT